MNFLSAISAAKEGKRLRSISISDKIEYDILNNINSSQWANMVCVLYQNRLLTGYASVGQSANNRIFWFDLTRVGSEGQPGSWARREYPAISVYESEGRFDSLSNE